MTTFLLLRLRPDTARAGAHAFVRFPHVVACRGHGRRDPFLLHVGEDCVTTLEIGNRGAREADAGRELRLRETCQGAQVTEKAFTVGNADQIRHPKAEHRSDASKGIDRRRRSTGLPLGDRAGTHTDLSSKLAARKSLRHSAINQDLRTKAAQYPPTHAWACT